MPPKKKRPPSSAEKKTFIATLQPILYEADKKTADEKGRVHFRRLTRREYQYTMHDLLGVDLPLVDFLPEDPATHGFETVASGQQLSHHHLGRYLDAADVALNEAFRRAIKGDETYKKTYAVNELGAKEKGRGNYRGPQHRGELCIHWPMRPQFYGRMPLTYVPKSGWYRITFKGMRAINPKNGVVWGTLESGVCFSDSPLTYAISTVEATAKPEDMVFEAWIQEGHGLRLIPNDATLKTASNGTTGGAVSYRGRDLEKEGYAALAHRGVTIERIYPNANREAVRKRLFGNISQVEHKNLRNKSTCRPIIRKLVNQFATRAFRRPVNTKEVEPYLKLAYDSLEEKNSTPFDALQVAYRAVLCSPRFLSLPEKAGALDNWAIASRLSYMLWNSMPDYVLRQAAQKGELKKPDVLKRHVDRMLADPKSERFIDSFTKQWLSLRDFDLTSPDLRMFRHWDSIVSVSMQEETRAFFRELIKHNLPVKHLIQSDFAMLNERLYRHYQLKDNVSLEPGKGMQKVDLKGAPRGGLITQGAILKVTANGTTTSPVIRGVWVNERILGTHIPPPPPGVPAIEPDIRGAVSIRDQLNKHRSSEACISCHLKIDPAGFALEHFDPVGKWRTKYGTSKKAVSVDASGTTPEGTDFKDIVQWKSIYVNRPDQLARGFAEQLTTYATGAPVRFSDRSPLNQIVKNAAKNKYGLRTLLKEVVTSDIFLHK